MKKRLVSGIKPTGNLTLGNYIGALKNFVKLQDDYDSYFFVADLHALTTGKVNKDELYNSRYETIAWYLACGLNPKKCNIFFQSDLSEHAEAQWLLTSEVAIGDLKRMTQFKDKAKKISKQENKTEKIPAGLLMYPVLMAADILIYNPDFVPIGEDQKQHLELTKNIAQKLKKHYHINLNIPQGIIPKIGSRIKSLTNPDIKMSKSEKSLKATIYLTDNPDLAYEKILKAVTDSENKIYLSEEKKGIYNLLNIYAALKNITLEETALIFEKANYAEFKKEVALVVKEELIKLQKNYQEAKLIVKEVALNGLTNAKKIAQENLKEWKDKMGFN
ncbi:tryptophan--tRNA ligase [Mycoplasmopsis meleagridis]|uniref:tryptophan--tRNA ligase n=1 Tax=Mycoplasmopsis meleagridis TaxID=29561 RepID=UPI00073D3C38|nr:tryptophan--tRNA ligase [Mycoplasmopsis meleagridis]KUH47288.1 tryptophan--tRNA ligase [Mycoplasmopsis meleagridis]